MFFSPPRIIAAVTVAFGVAGAGLAVATAGTAGATTTADDAFITQMNSVGVTFTSPQEAVKDGHQVCIELNAGKTGTQVAQEVLSQTDLTTKQAASFVVTATKIYCPQLSGQLT